MSEKCVVQVWLETDGETVPGSRAPFYYVETAYPDFESFLLAVDADRLIGGERLNSRWSRHEHRVREVHSRAPMAFRGSAVRRADLPDCRFQEEEAL